MTVKQLRELLEGWDDDLPVIDKDGRAVKGARIVDHEEGQKAKVKLG